MEECGFGGQRALRLEETWPPQPELHPQACCPPHPSHLVSSCVRRETATLSSWAGWEDGLGQVFPISGL